LANLGEAAKLLAGGQSPIQMRPSAEINLESA
jgi:hypothetical protein